MAWIIEQSIQQQIQGETFDLLIHTPTRDGKVLFQWHVHNKNLRNPFGQSRTIEVGESGQPVDISRNIACSTALQNKCKYILFYDSDVWPPFDGLEKLLSLRMPIVGGLYRSRGPPFQLLANKDDKPLPDNVLDAQNALVEVDEMGAGFMLVDTRVIKRYATKINNWQCLQNHKDKGVPVARFDDKTAQQLNYKCQYCQGTLISKMFDYRAGKASTLAISEDYFFERNIKQLCGFRTYAFTNVFCIHENGFGFVGREPKLQTTLTSAAVVK